MPAVVLKVALATLLYDSLGFPKNQDPRCTLISFSVLQCFPSDNNAMEVWVGGRFEPIYLFLSDINASYAITDDRIVQSIDPKIEVNLNDASKLAASPVFDYNVKMDYTFLTHTHTPKDYGRMDKTTIHASSVELPPDCNKNIIVSPDEPNTAYPNLVWVVCKIFSNDDDDIPFNMDVYMGNVSSDTIEWTLFHREHMNLYQSTPSSQMVKSFQVGKIDAIKQFLVIRYDHVSAEGKLITKDVVCKQSSTCSNDLNEHCCKYFHRQPVAAKHTFVDRQGLVDIEYDLTNMTQTFLPTDSYGSDDFATQSTASAELNYFFDLPPVYLPSYYTHAAYDTGIVVLHCYFESSMFPGNGNPYIGEIHWYTQDTYQKTFVYGDSGHNFNVIGEPAVCHLARFDWDDLFAISDPSPYFDAEFIMQLPQPDSPTLNDHFNRVTQYSVSCADKTPGQCNQLLVLGPSSDTETSFHVYFTNGEENPVKKSQNGVKIKYQNMRIDDMNYNFDGFSGDFTHRGTFYAFQGDEALFQNTPALIWVRVSQLDSGLRSSTTTWCAYKFDLTQLFSYDSGRIECSLTPYSFDVFGPEMLEDSYLTKFYIGHGDYNDCNSGLCSDKAPAATLNGIYSTVIRWFDGRKEFRTNVRESEYVPSREPMETIPDKHSGIAFENNDVVISETAVEVHHATLKGVSYFDAPVKMFKYGTTGTGSLPDTSAKVTLVGGTNETRLFAVSASLNYSVTIDAPGHRVCMGRDFVESDSPVKTVINGTTAVYALIEEDSITYRLDYWFITNDGVTEETKFGILKNQLTYNTYDLQLVCNQGQAATDWRVGYYPINIAPNVVLNAAPVSVSFNTWLDDMTEVFGLYTGFMSAATITEVQVASHSSRSGLSHEYYVSLGQLQDGTPEFCANVNAIFSHLYPVTSMCTTFSGYDNCTSLTLEDTSQYLGNDPLNEYAFGERDIFAMFMCKSSAADYEPTYFYYDFSANHITEFAHTSYSEYVYNQDFFSVCASNNEDRLCVDSIGFRTNFHTRGFDVLFFVGQTVYFFDVIVERGTLNYPVSTSDASLEITFPIQTSTAVYFEGWRNLALIGANFSDSTVLNILPIWLDTTSASANTSRVAVSSEIQTFKVWGVCQNNGECGTASAGDYVEFQPFAYGPALDDPDMIQFYLYEYGLPSNLTLLISSHTNESNIWSLLDPGGNNRNIHWRFGCASQESTQAVPFFTTDNTQACSGSSEIVSRFDSTAVAQLKLFRLEQEVDQNFMYCFSSERVSLGSPCGQHPMIHTSSTDCAADNDAYVCVVDDEIFTFDALIKTITSQCISMAGNCYDPDEYNVSTPTSVSLDDCAASCGNAPLCLGFEHRANECKLYNSVGGDDSFKGQPCSNGTLGFVCRQAASGSVFSTDVVIDPGGDPDFYTDIKLGNALYQRIVHGESPSSMSMDQSGHETHYVATFASSFNVTGGEVVYVCGQTSEEDTVLFSHPTTEDDTVVLNTVQQCYVSNENFTSKHDIRLVPAENGYMAFFDKSSTAYYFGHSFDQNEAEYYYTNVANDVGSVQFKKPPILAFAVSLPALIPLEKWNRHSPTSGGEFPLMFAPTPGKTLHSVLATEDSSRPYGENQALFDSYWYSMSVVPLEVFINDIRPVTVEDLEGATSFTGYSSKGSAFMEFDKNFAMFTTENSTGLVSDVLWGRFMNYKAYFAQTNKYDVTDETDFLRKYIFSMTEAVTFNLCPDNQTPDDPNYGKECVMSRMTRPVMNPLFSEVVTVNNNRLALGFTPYRVAPFMGVYLGQVPSETITINLDGSTRRRRSTDNEDVMMLMPDDAFIEEHGGIGFGAASTTPFDNDGTNDKVFSFGGLDYSPHSEYRPFEKLPFDMPGPLQWHPVWARKSQTFGCKAEAFDCTYSDDFYDNVVPQTELGTARNKFTSRTHVIGWAHSPDEFWHYYTPRHFQTPSYRESHKCGQGDVTVNMDLLDDIKSSTAPVPIPESKACGREFKINLPFAKDEKNVDFSRETVLSMSQFDEFKFLMTPRVEEQNTLTHALFWINSRKLPYFNKLWSSLLSLEWFNASEYRRSTDNFLDFSNECVDKRGIVVHEHYSTAGSGKYHTCRPLSSGTTLMAFHDMKGDSSCISNQCATALKNDCDVHSDPAEFTARYSNKGASRQVSNVDEHAHDVNIPTDFDLYDPSKINEDNYFWTDGYAGNGKAALFKLEHMESDIGFLSRECLLGQLALIKFIAHFDHEGTAFSSNFPVYKDTFLPEDGAGDAYNLSKVYSPTFFEAQFEAIHSTVYLGHNNDHLRKFCWEHAYGQVHGNHRRMTWTSNGASHPKTNDLKTPWPTKPSKLKFPSTFASGTFTKELPTEDGQAPTCPQEMCIGPYPALLPPFKMNCDFVNIDSRPTPQTDWRTCPMMPNTDFYAERGTNVDEDGQVPFLGRQIWRPPAFWHNKDNLWSSKAYRYNMDNWDTNPQPVDKVFKSTINGNNATTEVIGNLQCKRTGAVAQQSIVNPDLYYVCGGIDVKDIYSLGCTMCEVFDVSLGKGATIERNFVDETCRGFVVGLRIQQGTAATADSSDFGWVQVQYVCSETLVPRRIPLPNGVTEDDFYREIPPIMRTIHSIKTSSVVASESKEFDFVQVALRDDHGTMRSFPLGSARIPKESTDTKFSYGSPVFCFEPGKATATINIGAPDLDARGVELDIRGLDVVASTNQETSRKHIHPEGFTCVDANGVSQSLEGGNKQLAFWNPLKFHDSKEVKWSIEFMAIKESKYAVHTFERNDLLEAQNMTDLFGNVRWKTGTNGFFQSVAPDVKWGCINTGSLYRCGEDITCNTSVPCAVEYYDDASFETIQDAEDNINLGQNSQYGYITPRERLHSRDQTRFASYPGSFDEVPNVFGREACDTVRKNLPYNMTAMMLVDHQMLQRTGRPHFTEIAPIVVIRTPEACSDNSTACHTFAKDDSPNPIKICRHFVGCNKTQYINVTSFDASEPTFECLGFEKCQQTLYSNSRYTDIGPHAGYRPSCEFVKACAEPGFYRHHEPFDLDLGQVRLGTCNPRSRCSPTSFTVTESTAVQNAQCMQFKECTDEEYEATPGTGDKDRECIKTTVCEDTPGRQTLQNATATSDAVCFDIVTECPFVNQYFDNGEGGCKDATVCGSRQETKAEKTNTTDRQCVDLQECSFYEVEVPGKGLQTECRPTEHASHSTEVAMMATAGSIGFIACLLRVFFST